MNSDLQEGLFRFRLASPSSARPPGRLAHFEPASQALLAGVAEAETWRPLAELPQTVISRGPALGSLPADEK